MKKIVAVIAIHGREQITLKTVLRLKLQTHPLHKVLLIGDSPREEKLAQVTGSVFLRYPNNPLGAKWQAGMEMARQLDPDAILILGSDDWISDNWCARMMQEIEKGYDMVGKRQCFFLEVGVDGKKLIRWDGYTEPARRDEPIGAGRIISRKILDRMNWDWFNKTLNGGLDKTSLWSMLSYGGKVKLVTDDADYVIDIKSCYWKNIWPFEGIPASEVIGDPDQWLDAHFSDANAFFDILRQQYLAKQLSET